MLTRSNQVAPQQEYYADSLLTQPTLSQSVYNNLAMGFATPIVALNMLDSQFSKKPEGRAILSAFDAIRLQNETPGMSTSQWLASEGSNMLGFGLNPATWAFGEAGGLAARGLATGASRIAPDAASVFMRSPIKDIVSKPIGQYIPEMVGKEGAEKPLSFGLITDKAFNTFGTFAGAGVPQGIVDNYKADTNHIEWGGVAREAGEMGAFGLAIGSVPFAWGVLRGKINRGLGRDVTDPVEPSTLDKALAAGHITPDEHQWYNDYLAHQANPEDTAKMDDLKNRASQIINQNGHTANTVSNEAMFDILSPNDVSTLHGMIADQVAGGVPEQYQKALSDFVVHNRMDYIRQDPKWLDGVRGYVDFINNKLDNKASKLAEADKILDEHLEKGAKNDLPFSQKEIFKMVKQANFEPSHLKHLPITMPENMSKLISMNNKIKKLKSKVNSEKRRGLDPNKQTVRRIDELTATLPKILTPREELRQIRSDLLSKGLSNKFDRSNAYHRLLDLSNVWHNARTLLDRVHLEHEYKRQEAFRDLAHQTLKIADSDMPKLARPENVMDYLRRRIEGTLNKVEPIADVEKAVREQQAVPADSDTILSDQEAQIKNSKAEDARNEFNTSLERFKEFKESPNIFKNLISCVMGGLGG
jgi:hypothetical protein